MQQGPFVVVTSYTRFDNLAHSPKGAEANFSVRTFKLDPASGQLTLAAVNSDKKNR